MLSSTARAVAVLYFIGAGVLCYLTKVDHRRFAFSAFCSDEQLLVDSGKFGPQHCLEHLHQWESFAAWRDEYLNIAFPSIPKEISFALAIAVVSASKWLDIIIIAAGVVASLAVFRRITNLPAHAKTV